MEFYGCLMHNLRWNVFQELRCFGLALGTGEYNVKNGENIDYVCPSLPFLGWPKYLKSFLCNSSLFCKSVCILKIVGFWLFMNKAKICLSNVFISIIRGKDIFSCNNFRNEVWYVLLKSLFFNFQLHKIKSKYKSKFFLHLSQLFVKSHEQIM